MMDQQGKVANPARGEPNRENKYFPLSPFAPENLISRDGFGSPVPRQPAHLHTQAESGAAILGIDLDKFPTSSGNWTSWQLAKGFCRDLDPSVALSSL